jgi:hypothetical protein
MPKQITKYQCNYCTRSWVSRKRAEEHEKACLRNPVNKSCSTCFHACTDRATGSICGITGQEIFVLGKPVQSCSTWLSAEENPYE